MHALHVTAIITIRGLNPYVLISREQAALIKSNWRRAMPVLVQVNGQPNPPWRINMMPDGKGNFYLYLHGNVRKASHTEVGDTVTLDISFDTHYRNGPLHSIPSWFSEALADNKEAHKNWQALSPSRQKEILRYFSSLKSEEAIHRNINRAIYVLSGKSGRFMARSWNNGK